MRHLEDKLQKACVKWFDYAYPKYRLTLHHSPNGGKRNSIEAAKFKQMDVRAGFPDLVLLIPNKFYPFCGVELKTKQAGSRRIRKPIRRSLRVSALNMSLSGHLMSL